MKYTIDQYPKNKDVDFSLLSIDQIELRLNSVKYKHGHKIKCRLCGKKQMKEEFYVKDKKSGRRSTKCRDCQMKQAGVIEIGKQRFAYKISDKGFRRCTVCKDTKPLTEYKGNKGNYLGKSNTCYECSRNLLLEFTKNRRLKNRKPIYFIDGKDFVKKTEFAKYIKSEYGLPITTTLKRLSLGKTEEECKISNFEMRSLRFKK